MGERKRVGKAELEGCVSKRDRKITDIMVMGEERENF